MINLLKKIILLNFILLKFNTAFCWGYFAHKKINYHAIFTLPPEMFDFYKHYENYLIENSVTPDKRRYILKEEGAKHYIDIDYFNFNNNFFENYPKSLREAISRYTKEILETHGILPWNIEKEKQKLIRAFKEQNTKMILKISAELGHYLADANVPLHTTENYDGQKTDQIGIHSFWESRIPELFYENFNLFVGKAEYIKNTNKKVWSSIKIANSLLKDLFEKDKLLTKKFPKYLKYSFIQKNKNITKVISEEYSIEFNQLTKNKVEEQMRRSIKLVGSFWMTCWIDAGKPDLGKLLGKKMKIKNFEEEIKNLEKNENHGMICE